MSKHVPSYLITEEENDIVLDVLGSKRYSLATAVVQLLLALPTSRERWEKYVTGVGCLVKDGTTRSYYIRIVDIKNQTIVWEQELYRQFKYRAVNVTFHTFNAHDCRAGLNFCDEEEALLFRAAIRDRIREFKRKREANRARKMARNYHAMLQQQATYQSMPTMLQYIPSSIAGQQTIYQVAPQASLIAGMAKGRGKAKAKGRKAQLAQMQGINSQMDMQHGMNVFTIQTGPGGTRQVVQVPREGLYGTASSIYGTVDKRMADMAISRSTTSTQEKKKKKRGLLGFLKRKKNDIPSSSSQISTLEPNAKKDRAGAADKQSKKPPRPLPPKSPVLERPLHPPPSSSPTSSRPPAPTSTVFAQPPTPSSPKPPQPPSLSSPKPPRAPLPTCTVSSQPHTPSSPKSLRPPHDHPSRQLDSAGSPGVGTIQTQKSQPLISSGVPPPPPPPPLSVTAAPPPPPPPPPPTLLPGEIQYDGIYEQARQPVGGSLMDGILSGANKLKKVDQPAQKPKSYQAGVGGALARAMDLRSKVMQDSDDDDDDDDDDWDEEDDDEWSD